jgi:hypothetical protein
MMIDFCEPDPAHARMRLAKRFIGGQQQWVATPERRIRPFAESKSSINLSPELYRL